MEGGEGVLRSHRPGGSSLGGGGGEWPTGVQKLSGNPAGANDGKNWSFQGRSA